MIELPQEYFKWLYARVFRTRDIDSNASYSIVCDHMHRVPFKATVPHDQNRLVDGTDLRTQFLSSYKLAMPELERVEILIRPASVFEVLVALADRAAFMIDNDPYFWFDVFVKNLKLGLFTDRRYRAQDTFKIEKIIMKFNDRRYDERGLGGIFPLMHAEHDQRQVDLWYQMGTYMTEKQMY